MKLSEIVAQYLIHLPAGIVLEEGQITRSLRKAVRLYCGYATLTNAPSAAEIFALAAIGLGLPSPLFPIGDVHSPINAEETITDAQDFDLTASEWALIRPLFDLYVENENAQSLEASRALGLDVYGRATSEIAQDIRDREERMPDMCFVELVVSI